MKPSTAQQKATQKKAKPLNTKRRHWLKSVGLMTGLFGVSAAQADHTDSHMDDEALHKLVMNCNKADDEYLNHTLFSVSELIRKYGDDIEIIVECYGPGIHLLGKEPKRPVDKKHQEKASSLSQYGVAFHACNNTMKSLEWQHEDLLAFSKVVEAGIDDLMLLQEKGFAYAAW